MSFISGLSVYFGFTDIKQFIERICHIRTINTRLSPWQPEPLNRNESGRFGALKSDSTHHFCRNACTKSGSLRFSKFSGCWLILSLYNYEFWLSLCKIVRSSVILLLPLFAGYNMSFHFFICMIQNQRLHVTCHHRSRRGRDRTVVGFTTTYAISTYHH